MKKLIAISTTVFLLASSPITQADWGGHDERLAGTMTGALVGAAGGALLGYQINQTQGAVIGGTAGAIAGGVIGNKLADRGHEPDHYHGRYDGENYEYHMARYDDRGRHHGHRR